MVPLAVPLLAGPGAIGTTIIAAQSRGIVHLAAMVASSRRYARCLLACAAHRLAPRLGTTGLNIATHLSACC